MKKLPILFIIFNREDTTKAVFEAIRKYSPEHLYVAADGPRNKVGEKELCQSTRDIINSVDWKCKVSTKFEEKNLGCRNAVSEAISWFFESEEEGIILEDDCLPDPSFFDFCEIMLERYRNDERIMMVSGTNNLITWKQDRQDYHYSIYGSIWGWATWKRAWAKYDVNMLNWGTEPAKEAVKNLLCDDSIYKTRATIFDAAQKNIYNTWDYQWTYARMINSGLAIVPSKNLISNIGFGENATHTTDKTAKYSDLRRNTLTSFRENLFVVADRDYDRSLYGQQNKRNLSFKSAIKKMLKKVVNIPKAEK